MMNTTKVLEALQPVGGQLISVDPAMGYERLEGSGTDVFHLINPEAGTWRIEMDGGALVSNIWGRAVAFGETDTKLKADIPSVVRPGEKFTVGRNDLYVPKNSLRRSV